VARSLADVGCADRREGLADQRVVPGRRLGADGDLARHLEQLSRLERVGRMLGIGEGVTMLWTVLALICIIVGFLSAVIEEQILMPVMAWFVLAIAFNTLGGISAFTFTKRS
jgi:hypothetical protein